VHGVETFENYEQSLIDSLRRQPSEMGIVMLRRIFNTGASTVAGITFKDIVGELISAAHTPTSVKDNLTGMTG
jgi:hypothetical protein